MNITCRQDAMNRVSELMNEKLVHVETGNELVLNDIIVEIKDTEDVETLTELKTYINGIIDNEIVFRLKSK